MRKYVLGIVLLAGLFALYGYRLNVPEKEYYDEVYHVKTAREFTVLNGNTDTAHPPFGKILMALSLKTLGDNPWAWRMAPFLSGCGAIIVFFFLARRFFGSSGPALTAAFLLAIDGISFTQARIAMLNASMLLFMCLSLWTFIRFLDTGRLWACILTGVFLGLTAGTRWVGLGVIFIMVMLTLRAWPGIPSKRSFLLKLVLMTAVILGIYLLANLILLFVHLGYVGFKGLWYYQTTMLKYHWNLKSGHPYGSAWWGWPLILKNIWYYYNKSEAGTAVIVCMGNPAVLWGFIPCVFYMLWRFLKSRELQPVFILLGFLSQWLPWAAIKRVKFFHYYYAALPFVALGIAYCLRKLWQSGRSGRVFAGLYLAIAAGLFAYWYPLLSAFPVSDAYIQGHMWFKSWNIT